MPELPEVEVIARELKPYLEGERIEAVVTLDSTLWEKGTLKPTTLKRGTITKVWRRGKYLIKSSTKGDLLLHLRMTGRLIPLSAKDQNDKDRNYKVITPRLWLIFASKLLLFSDKRRLGKAVIVPDARAFLKEKGLGPEPLPWNWEAYRSLAQALMRSRRPIKMVLLDQRVIAGVGNIYADEALHRAGIHPKTLAVRLKKRKIYTLYRAIVTIFSEAIAKGGSTIRDYFHLKGSGGEFQRFLKVYNREGERCRSCGKGEILRIVISKRSSWFCPRCQPPPYDPA